MLSPRSLAVLAVIGVGLAACGKKNPPPPVITPTQTNQPGRDTTGEGQRRLDQMREDSIARANAARADADARTSGERARLRAALEEMVFFDYDQSSIREDARSVLARKVQILRNNPGVTLRIEGHADERGSVEYNLALSHRRANAIRDYLTSIGIDASRFEIVPMGEERPLSSGTSEEAFQRNRRGEFHITRGADTLR